MTSGIPFGGDQPTAFESDSLSHVPVDQGVGDRAVELLVARVLGTNEGQLDLALGHGMEDRHRALEVPPR